MGGFELRLEGRGGRRRALEPGQAAYGPRGVAHSYLVRSETARLAAVFAPGQVEEWFTGNDSPVSAYG